MTAGFEWRRQGRVFAPDGSVDWMRSHAQNPTSLILQDRIRVYFNCRPAANSEGLNVSWPTFVDLDRTDPTRVLRVHDRPVLAPGGMGTFDEHGVMASSVLRGPDGELWLYYVGWERTVGAPYNHAIGLAISRDGGIAFERAGLGPLMTRSLHEPHLHNSPHVVRINGVFHMWYSAGTSWIEHAGRPESVYVLMHATSDDGTNWRRDGRPCMPATVEYECQTSPSLLYRDGICHMWFCYRHGVDFRNRERGYRIGYAWSADLEHWQRDDSRGGMGCAISGWDAEMVCYPCIFEADGRVGMFYSGNGFGREGFGLAWLS